MMTSLEKKQPSDELLALIKSAADTISTFGELWEVIREKGKKESFTEKELMGMLRPLLKPKLSSKQIYYLFHREQEVERSRQNREKSTYIRTNDAKNEPEQSYVQTWSDVISPEETDIDKQIAEADKGPVTVFRDQIIVKSDEDAQMEAIAMKLEPTKPAVVHGDEEVHDMDLYVLRERIALFELNTCAEIIIRQLRQLKSEGWKIVELTARRIT